jgi:hypothetical protein
MGVSGTQNRVFFPQAAVDDWIVEGSVDFRDGELTILAGGRRFQVTEAVHILHEVSGGGDTHDLAGRVKLRSFLDGLGAEILESSMLLGEAAYDVTPGWVGVPIGSFAEHAASTAAPTKGRAGASVPKNDEELLARFGLGNR